MAHDGLSTRALRALQPALSYQMAFSAAKARPWSEADPGGNIICSVAENQLSTDLIHERFVELQQGLPASEFTYPRAFRGTPEAREAVARMMQRTLMQGITIDPEHLAMLSGAGACLEFLFHSLCGLGDGILLPVPTYPAFINDIEVRSGAKPILFSLSDDPDAVGQELTDAAAAGEAAGHTCKMVLLTNPNNPLGTVYKPTTVMAVLRWCLLRDIHFLSDEMYALNVWGEDEAQFEGAEVLARRAVAEGQLPAALAERVPKLLHTVIGISKDLCASGLRVGIIHTRNTSLMRVIDNICYFSMCSTPTLWVLTRLLNDEAFIDSFFKENKRRMRESYKGLADALDAAKIPHLRACAAMFAWVDLRQWLQAPGWEGEHELFNTLVAAGVLLTPGEACKAAEPGWFRICWAWVPPAALPAAVLRIKALPHRSEPN